MTALLAPPHSSLPAATATPPLVLEPPRHLDLSPQLLTPGQIRIGSGPDCQIRLNVDGIASEHGTILAGTHRVILRASDPRTWLNDGPVKEGTLRHGDRVAFGPVCFRIRRANADELLAGWPAPDVQTAAAPAIPENVREAIAEPQNAVADDSASWLVAAESIEPTLIETAHGPAATDDVATVWTGGESNLAPFTIATSAVDWPALPEPVKHPSDQASADVIADLQRQQAELARLRESLDATRAAFREEALRREEQFTVEAVRLTRHSHELLTSQAQLDDREQQLRNRGESLAAREEQLHTSELALAHRERLLATERDRLAEVAGTTREQLQSEATRQAAEWQTWEGQQQKLLTQFTEQSAAIEQQRIALGDQQCRLDATEHELRQLRQDLEQQRSDLRADREQLSADRIAFQADRDAWLADRRTQESQHRTREQALQLLEQELQLRSDHVRRQQEQLTLDIRERARSQAELQSIEQQLQEDRRLFSDRQSGWQQERDAAWQDITERRKRLDAEADLLQAARHEIERLEQALEAEVHAVHADRLRWQTESRLQSDPVADVPATVDAIELDTNQCPAAEDTEGLGEEEIATEESALLTGSDDVPVDDDAPESFDETESAEPVSEMEDIQAALDALAERFEEFSVLEHRLTVRHDELLELQQDLAVREAALDAEREALGLERVTWEADRAMWAEEQVAWESQVADEQTRHTAWEIARQSQLADIAAERRRWSAHMAELSATLPPAVPPVIESGVEQPSVDEASFAADQTPSGVAPPDLIEATSEIPLIDCSIESTVADDDQPPTSSEIDNAVEMIPAASIWETPLPELPPVEAQEAPSELRSELAKMFNLPDDFAERHEPSAEETTEAAEPDWRQSLMESLTATPEPVAEPVEAASEPTTAEPEAHTEEDSVASYMEQLLARTRQRTGAPEDQEAAVEPESVTPARVVDSSSASMEIERPTDAVPTRQKIDRHATRAEMQSFREVANLSARTALAAHSWKTTKTEFVIQNVLLLLSAAGTATFFTGPLRGAAIQWFPGSVCLIAAGWMAYRAFQTWQTLRRWRADAAPAASPSDDLPEEAEPNESPIAESVTEITDAIVEPPVAEATPVSEDVVADDSHVDELPTEALATETALKPANSLWDDVWEQSSPDSDSAE